jgi:outer membrane lipoprotein-sorting protein
MTDSTEYRDEILGAALRELEVPGHRPDFHDELRRRLADERMAPLRPTRKPRRRFNRRRVALALVAAAVAAAVVAIGIPRGGDESDRLGGPGVASAAEIKAKVRSAFDTMRNLSGELVSDGPQKGDKLRWHFTVTAKGDFALTGPTRGERMTYDASTGVARSALRSESLGGGPLFYTERTGVAPGLPDPAPPSSFGLAELRAYVDALLAAQDPRVRETTYEGRPAWVLAVDTAPNALSPVSGDRFDITVDRESGMPVHVLETKNGNFVNELAILDLTVNADLAPRTFALDFPAGAEVSHEDEGFERVPLHDVEGIVDYAPLVPGWAPDGYELAEVAVARRGQPTGTEGGNPVSRMVVSLSYRRGLDQFLVTTRLNDGGPWSDPLATGEGFVDEPDHVVLEGGALDGRSAELLVVPRGIPHLWTQSEDLVVTVGGALGRAELLRVAGSLQAR